MGSNIQDYVLLGTAPVTSLVSDPKFGPDGFGGLVQGTSESAIPLFDFRPYQKVLVIWEGTFANAETIELSVRCAWRSPQSSTNEVIYNTSGTNGETLVFLLGDVGDHFVNSGDQYFSGGRKLWSPLMPPFARIGTHISGATGTITGGRITVYGIRQR